MSEYIVLKRSKALEKVLAKNKIQEESGCYVMNPEGDVASFLAMGIYASSCDPNTSADIMEHLMEIDKVGFAKDVVNTIYGLSFSKNFGNAHHDIIEYSIGMKKKKSVCGFSLSTSSFEPESNYFKRVPHQNEIDCVSPEQSSDEINPNEDDCEEIIEE